MAAVVTKLHEAVNELIESCRDGESRFEASASAVNDERLRVELTQYARQRSEFVVELGEVMDAVGGMPAKHGNLIGVLHRGWMELNEILMGASEQAVLEECERGEETTVHCYSQILHLPMPSMIGEVVASQYHAVKIVRDRIKALIEKTGKN